MKFIATAAFGLEAIVRREVENLGGENIEVQNGKVNFTGKVEDIPKYNMWLRTADRLLINFGEFKAYTFDELFEKTKALPWGDLIPKDGEFIVTGKSIDSKLFSVPDCQGIVKKAIVEKMKEKYKIEWFQETGALYKVQVALLKDTATITIDTTGDGLFKRGYRFDSVSAPIKETLGAAMINLSFWNKDRLFLDPFCGSGTLAIEAALMARNIAPGIGRDFVSMDWEIIDKKIWKDVKADAYSKINLDIKPEIYASDIDPKAIEIAKHNAELAGVDDSIYFETKAFTRDKSDKDYGVLVTNPPYGDRMGEKEEVIEIQKDLGIFHKNNPTWSMYIITANEFFEKDFGKNADRKRKLFNGNIKTDYYQYYGPRPPRD